MKHHLSHPFAPTCTRYQMVSAVDVEAADPRAGVEVAAQVASNGTTLNTDAYSPPVFKARKNTPVQMVGWWDSQGSKTASSPGVKALLARMTAVPIPAALTAAAGTDNAAVVWQPSTDIAVEGWRWRLNTGTPGPKNVPGDQWQISWGGRLDNVSLNTSSSFKDAATAALSDNGSSSGHGVSASGLSLLGGTATLHELLNGITRALDISLPGRAKPTTHVKGDGISWPAYRSDGNLPIDQPSKFGGVFPLCEGQRLVLPPGIDTSAMHPIAAVLTKGLQDYGCIIRDGAAAVVMCAQNPIHWTAKGQVDPYVALFTGTTKSKVMRQIPWGQLRALPMGYGS